MSILRVHHLGLTEYGQAYRLQEKLLRLRLEDAVPDTLLLLEHPPTLTFGRDDDMANLLVPKEELARQGLALYPTDRGGSITWHGPGQLVAYPIMDLKNQGRDLHEFVDRLEEVIIRTLGDFNIQAGRDEDHVGVWVGRDKIAAIGIRVRKWVTKHGFALNVNSDLAPFSLINPCGLPGSGVTSMAGLLDRQVDLTRVREVVLKHFGAVFKATLDQPAGGPDFEGA